MSRRLEDILRDLPPGLTEADVVAMVDGDVPPQREALVIDALQQRPMLGLIVKQMRVDQAALRSLGEFTAAPPTNLLEGIQAKLDRDALAELVHEAEEASAPIPISQAPRVGMAGGGVIRVLAESMWARRLATAASIAIVGALGLFGARQLADRWPKLPGTVTLTQSPPPPQPAGPTTPTLVASETPSQDPTGPSVPSVAATEVAAAESVPLSPAEAVALAREGRLVITVRSTRVGETLRQLEGLSRTAAADVRWRAYDLNRLPQELAALSLPSSDSALARHDDPRQSPNIFAAASDDLSGDLVGPRPAPVIPDIARVVVKGVHVVRMAADSTRLGDLVRDLNITKTQVAEFRALPVAIEHPPALDAESVLWWSAASESWSPRIAVPIVIETEE